MKAMILAAGRGERMRPLTDFVPKPLAPFGNGRLIDPLLMGLKHAGIHEIVINVCYFAEQIIEYLGDGSQFGLSIQYSQEFKLGELETGGGVINALSLLGENPFILVSADVVTDFPFQQLVNKSAIAGGHLVLVNNPSFHTQGDFHLNTNGTISLQGDNMLTFGNISVFNPQLFSGYPLANLPLGKLFKSAITKQILTGEHYSGSWHNIGTLEQLQDLSYSLQSKNRSI